MADKGSGWVAQFASLSAARRAALREGRSEHLHQTAGWYDIDDAQVWRDYVLDAVGPRLESGLRVFEAGCGVLAFLQVLHTAQPGLALAGVDGCADSIDIVRNEIAPKLEIDGGSFRVGQLPQALEQESDAQYGLTVCNSVLQYLPKDDAWKVIDALWRMTRPGGSVVLADLCDIACRETENAKLAEYWQGYATELPAYTYFGEADFARFTERGGKVEIRRSAAPGYRRAATRFIVALEKPGA